MFVFQVLCGFLVKALKSIAHDLSYSLNVQICHVKCAGFADVDAVDSHKGIGHGLTTVCGDGIGDVVRYHIHTHATLDTDATCELAALDGYSVYHIVKI